MFFLFVNCEFLLASFSVFSVQFDFTKGMHALVHLIKPTIADERLRGSINTIYTKQQLFLNWLLVTIKMFHRNKTTLDT